MGKPGARNYPSETRVYDTAPNLRTRTPTQGQGRRKGKHRVRALLLVARWRCRSSGPLGEAAAASSSAPALPGRPGARWCPGVCRLLTAECTQCSIQVFAGTQLSSPALLRCLVVLKTQQRTAAHTSHGQGLLAREADGQSLVLERGAGGALGALACCGALGHTVERETTLASHSSRHGIPDHDSRDGRQHAARRSCMLTDVKYHRGPSPPSMHISIVCSESASCMSHSVRFHTCSNMT